MPIVDEKGSGKRWWHTRPLELDRLKLPRRLAEHQPRRASGCSRRRRSHPARGGSDRIRSAAGLYGTPQRTSQPLSNTDASDQCRTPGLGRATVREQEGFRPRSQAEEPTAVRRERSGAGAPACADQPARLAAGWSPPTHEVLRPCRAGRGHRAPGTRRSAAV